MVLKKGLIGIDDYVAFATLVEDVLTKCGGYSVMITHKGEVIVTAGKGHREEIIREIRARGKSPEMIKERGGLLFVHFRW